MSRIGILLIILAVQSISALGMPEPGMSEQDEASKMQFAAGQHEIISLLIQQERYGSVLPEFRKILKLGLRNEKLVVQEAWIIVEQLRELDQHALALQLIDETVNVARTRQNKFSLLMLKGKVLQDQGRADEAISIYREAQDLKK
ncbi:MAG: hypothetical protein HY645_11455 [Acidobacteria bacterium]|nr:hypothetical protein [Acidobacteriota bacterium]